MKRKLNVAVAVNFSTPKSIWSNGGNQHGIFMYLLLKQLPYVDNVWLITDNMPDGFAEKMFLNDFKEDIYRFDDVIDQVDLLVEMTAYIKPRHAEAVRNRGGKLVSYRFGNDYVMSVESCSLGGHEGWVPHPHRITFDEVWTNEQHVNTCLSYVKHLYKAPVQVLPHLWAPLFIEEALQRNEKTLNGWPYHGLGEKFPITIFEPNINVVKSAIIPFYAASKFYDDNADVVSNIFMLNTLKLAKNPLFKRIVSDTKAGQDGVATAEKRHSLVDFMGQSGGIVLCHQWENGLNYVYYEALYGGYPLVHNSPFLKHVGYYYDQFDIDAGAQALETAWLTHDKNLADYKAAALDFLETVSPYSDNVIQSYSKRIEELMK
jgi:hypothetical protein